MAQFEYQVLEQAGGRVSHLNDRLAQLVAEGFDPIMMTGTSPQVSILMRRPLQAAQARPAQAQAAVAHPAAAQTPAPAAPAAPAAVPAAAPRPQPPPPARTG